jgi:2-dehydro-3-deoxyphosphogluconate aldolase/(4S)-4-hydroxy-2-oxoglutarate aldolase
VTNNDIVGVLERTRVLPVLTIASVENARAIADGLLAGGLPIAEVTLRTDSALPALRVLADAGGIAVGAGTVLSVDDAKRAVDAGATYLVSPGITPAVVDWCAANGVVLMPGVATPSEALAVRDAGIRIVKLFPASVVGGAAWLRAVGAPIPDLRFVATGGVTDASLPAYLAAPNLLAVGGSWFMPSGGPVTADAVAAGARSVRERIATIAATSADSASPTDERA